LLRPKGVGKHSRRRLARKQLSVPSYWEPAASCMTIIRRLAVDEGRTLRMFDPVRRNAASRWRGKGCSVTCRGEIEIWLAWVLTKAHARFLYGTSCERLLAERPKGRQVQSCSLQRSSSGALRLNTVDAKLAYWPEGTSAIEGA
jgi:hypothetical protein